MQLARNRKVRFAGHDRLHTGNDEQKPNHLWRTLAGHHRFLRNGVRTTGIPIEGEAEHVSGPVRFPRTHQATHAEGCFEILQILARK